MEEYPLDNLFHIASRLIIIFPVFVIIIALILKFNQSPSIKSTPQLTPIPIKSGQAKQNNAPINLTGPLVCNFSSPTATISGYIKDKKISATVLQKNKTNYFLVRDDCLYIWEKNIYFGTKKCGLSPYFALLNNLPLNQLANFSNLPIKGADIQNLINSCKKEEVKNDAFFEIPKFILFK